MIKKIILLFFFISSFISVSQAQTEEETVEWLRSKFYLPGCLLQKELSTYYPTREIHVSFEKDQCAFRVKYYYGDNSLVYIFIPVKSELHMWNDHISADYNIFETVYNGAIIKMRMTTEFEIGEPEPNLQQRILKALKHLSTFCEKNDEKF